MDQLYTLRVFVAVAETGGFAAAARRLGLSAAAVTRSVAALERHLGARLFQRSTRQVRLTDVGRAYLDDGRHVLDALGQADARASGAREVPQGHLTVTAPVLFGRLHVSPLLLDFLAQYPLVTARMLLVDRVVNLVEEGLDVAVRIARLADSGLQAIPVGVVRRVLVASPEYLLRQGMPTHPEQLAAHHAIGLNTTGGPALPWQFAAGADAPERLRSWAQPHVRFTVNASDVALQAARAGHGLARVLSYQVIEDVAAGRLRVVLEDFETPAIPVQLVHAEGRQAAAKVRAFIDFAAARLRSHPALRERRR
ncbi:MAG: LysR family transcriptional regulator [Pseudomonadota bacterium]|nr:LysR family transcriptional regulator [Pseudomonadota bacterium]